MGDVIQIDGGTNLCRIFEFMGRGIVGGEHNILSLYAHGIAEHQLCQGGTVTSAAVISQNIDQERIGCRLYCEKLLVTLVPCKCFFQCFCILPDSLFIIDMKRCGIFFCDLFNHFFGNKCLFFHKCLLCIYSCLQQCASHLFWSQRAQISGSHIKYGLAALLAFLIHAVRCSCISGQYAGGELRVGIQL